MGEFHFRQQIDLSSIHQNEALDQDQDQNLPSSTVAMTASAVGHRNKRSDSIDRARGSPMALGALQVTSAQKNQKSVQLRIFQILSPNMVWRGRVFGTFLALKPDDWKPVDASYFDAPGVKQCGAELYPDEADVLTRVP